MKLTMTIGDGPEQIVGLALDAETINAIILLIRVARTATQSIALHLNDGMMNRWADVTEHGETKPESSSS